MHFGRRCTAWGRCGRILGCAYSQLELADLISRLDVRIPAAFVSGRFGALYGEGMRRLSRERISVVQQHGLGHTFSDFGLRASLGRILAFEGPRLAPRTRHATATTSPRERALIASTERLDGDSVRAVFPSIGADGVMTQLMTMEGITGQFISWMAQERCKEDDEKRGSL